MRFDSTKLVVNIARDRSEEIGRIGIADVPRFKGGMADRSVERCEHHDSSGQMWMLIGNRERIGLEKGVFRGHLNGAADCASKVADTPGEPVAVVVDPDRNLVKQIAQTF